MCLQCQCVFCFHLEHGEVVKHGSHPRRWKFLCADSAAACPPQLGLSSTKKCPFESLIRKVWKRHCSLSLGSQASSELNIYSPLEQQVRASCVAAFLPGFVHVGLFVSFGTGILNTLFLQIC